MLGLHDIRFCERALILISCSIVSINKLVAKIDEKRRAADQARLPALPARLLAAARRATAFAGLDRLHPWSQAVAGGSRCRGGSGRRRRQPSEVRLPTECRAKRCEQEQDSEGTRRHPARWIWRACAHRPRRSSVMCPPAGQGRGRAASRALHACWGMLLGS